MGPAPVGALTDALAGVTALAFDTAPLIYFIERHPTYLELMRGILGRVDAGTILAYSAVVTLTEVLTKPMEASDVGVARAYRDLLLDSRNFTPVPIDAAIAERAASLRARYRLRTPDALQLAAALLVGCEAFLTNDSAMRRVTDLRVLVLDELMR